MAKTTKALSGAAKSAYLARTLQAEPELSAEAQARLAERLSDEIRYARVRCDAIAAEKIETADATQAPPDAEPFDPFTPNVVVVIRTEGRAAALEALQRITDVGNLRLLAREQQLSIDAGLTRPDDLAEAIVAAAERRIANRRAAAS
jgi:hypothetical protein